MGSADADKRAFKHGKPQHRVTITKPFYLGAHEVTAVEYYRVMVEDPSEPFADDERMPASGISWTQATEFCRRLSEKKVGHSDSPPKPSGSTHAVWEARRVGPLKDA